MLFPCPWVGQLHHAGMHKSIQFWKRLSSLFDWQQLLVHKRILYFSLSCQQINFDCLCYLRMHQIPVKLPIKCSRSHDVSHISFYPWEFCCQWVLYSPYVPRPKMTIASLAIWDRKSKDMAHPLRANGKFVIPNLSHHFVPTHPSCCWSGSDWIATKSALWQICCLKLCLEFLWRFLNFIQVVGSPSGIFIVPDEVGKKSSGIHGGTNPRVPLCEDETATRGCGLSAL